jgi:polyhydroxybutyrate depolymerase
MPACAAASHRPIPLLAIHGTADPIVPFDSGELEGNLAYWVRRNGCATSPTVAHLPDTDPNDGTRTRVESYADCQDGADVVLYAIEGGGHRWPGGDEPIFLAPHGRTSRDFDGATVIWDFLKAHPKPAVNPRP